MFLRKFQLVYIFTCFIKRLKLMSIFYMSTAHININFFANIYDICIHNFIFFATTCAHMLIAWITLSLRLIGTVMKRTLKINCFYLKLVLWCVPNAYTPRLSTYVLFQFNKLFSLNNYDSFNGLKARLNSHTILRAYF